MGLNMPGILCCVANHKGGTGKTSVASQPIWAGPKKGVS